MQSIGSSVGEAQALQGTPSIASVHCRKAVKCVVGPRGRRRRSESKSQAFCTETLADTHSTIKFPSLKIGLKRDSCAAYIEDPVFKSPSPSDKMIMSAEEPFVKSRTGIRVIIVGAGKATTELETKPPD